MDITRWIWHFLLFSPIKTILLKRADRFHTVGCVLLRPKHFQAQHPTAPVLKTLFSTHCVLTRNPAHF